MKNTILASCTAVSLIFSNVLAFNLSASAADTLTISASSATVDPGDTATIKIDMSNNAGIVSWKVLLNYDSDALEISSFNGGVFNGVSTGPLTNVPFSFSWCDSINGNYTTNGTIAEITFKVKENAAPGTYNLTLSGDQADFFDADFNDVPVSFTAGAITVNGSTPSSSEESSSEESSSETPTPTPEPEPTPSTIDPSSSEVSSSETPSNVDPSSSEPSSIVPSIPDSSSNSSSSISPIDSSSNTSSTSTSTSTGGNGGGNGGGNTGGNTGGGSNQGGSKGTTENPKTGAATAVTAMAIIALGAIVVSKKSK